MTIISDGNFDVEILKSDIPVLVYFWSQFCVQCLAAEPKIKELDSRYQGKLKICKANIGENNNFVSQYGIMAIPSFLFFKDGEKVDHLIGNLPLEQIEEKIKNII